MVTITGPVSGDDGRLAGYLGTCHDISERRDAELSARAKEGEIRTLAEPWLSQFDQLLEPRAQQVH